MNIFVLDENPQIAAQMHNDKIEINHIGTIYNFIK